MQFGENLKVLRKQKKLSQDALAKLLSVSQRQISAYENNETFPQIPSLIALADYFNVTLDSLLGRKSSLSESNQGTLDYSFKFGNLSHVGKLYYLLGSLPDSNKQFIILEDNGNILKSIIYSNSQMEFLILIYLLNLRLGIKYDLTNFTDNFDIIIAQEDFKTLAVEYDSLTAKLYDIRYAAYLRNVWNTSKF